MVAFVVAWLWILAVPVAAGAAYAMAREQQVLRWFAAGFLVFWALSFAVLLGMVR